MLSRKKSTVAGASIRGIELSCDNMLSRKKSTVAGASIRGIELSCDEGQLPLPCYLSVNKHVLPTNSDPKERLLSP